jgi:heme/copper-type cytochrome/quinol oxidase subunit 2
MNPSEKQKKEEVWALRLLWVICLFIIFLFLEELMAETFILYEEKNFLRFFQNK